MATYSVMKPLRGITNQSSFLVVWTLAKGGMTHPTSGSSSIPRAKPKSQILSSQSAFTSKFPGCNGKELSRMSPGKGVPFVFVFLTWLKIAVEYSG